MSISTRLYTLRVDHGYSQDDLAQIIGVSRQAISKWERAESVPDTDKLVALSELYGLTIDEILKGESEGVAAPTASSEEETSKAKDAGLLPEEADESEASLLECASDNGRPAEAHVSQPSQEFSGSHEDSVSPSPKRRGAVIAFIAVVVLALALIVGRSLADNSENGDDGQLFFDSKTAEETIASYSSNTRDRAKFGDSEAWEVGDDRLFSGENVMLEGDILGNLFAAGSQVGGSNLSVAMDAFLAGQTVVVAGWDVGNAIFAAGEHVAIGAGSQGTHAKALFCSGRDVSVKGDFDSAHLAGERVVIDGTFSGDVFVEAETVEVHDLAVINGTLHVGEDSNLVLSDNAQVSDVHWFKDLSFGLGNHEGMFFTVLFGLLSSLAVAALLLLILGNKPVKGALALTRNYPARVFVTGAIALICTPVVGFILLVTVLALPAAVVVALLLVSTALLCVPFAAICLGRALFPSWNRWASGLLCAAAFSLVMNAPIIGPLLWLASIVFTLGCLLTTYWRGRRGL